MTQGGRHANGRMAVAERVAGRLAGNPGIVRLRAVMDTYDRSGGGLVAGGLAYGSLLAVLPGLLIGLSAVGWLVRDTTEQQQIVALISQTLPPFTDLAAAAFDQVSGNAVPSGIVAILTLLWGSSRFYANLDTAFSRIFSGAPRRNAIDQTIRGVVLTIGLFLVPVGLVTLGSILSSLAQLVPGSADVSGAAQTVVIIVSPILSLVAFVVAVVLCLRYVPSERVPWRALLLPAGVAGVVLALLTQVYAFIAPRLLGVAALYGAVFAIFALLAWLSLAFNVLLLGAAWTDVRAHQGKYLEAELKRLERDVEAEPGRASRADGSASRPGGGNARG